ncbi:MAG: hypothetical protein JSS66_14045 [Armatimonadetes bacterium]|nr:hypothetical protein [Armatimonadota bacterium]
MFEKKGCQVLAFITMFFVAVGLLFTGTCRGLFTGANGPGGEGAANPVVVTVSGEQVLGQDVLDMEAENQKQNPSTGDPKLEFYSLCRALDDSMNIAATTILAKQRGIKVDEKVITNVFNKQFKTSLDGQKMQLVQQGKLKAGATDAEFAAEFKKLTGKTPDEMHKDNLADLLAKLKTSDGPKIEKAVTGLALADSYEVTTNVTLDQLKQEFETLNIKRLTFSDPKMKPEDKKKAADSALAEIKAGLKFDDAMARYGKGQPTAPIGYTRMIIGLNPALKPLLDLKPGGVSDVMDEFGSYSIYYLVDKKQNLPADFDKNKDQYLSQFKSEEVRKAVTKDLDALKKDSTLKWSNEACHIAYQVYESERNPGQLNREQKAAKMKELSDALGKLQVTDVLGQRMRILGRYAAFEAYFLATPQEQQKDLLEERSRVLEEVTTITESTDLRLAIYDNYVRMADYEKAGDALLEAARNNSGTDQNSVGANSSIVSKVTAAKKDGKVSKEILEEIDNELARWRKERAEEAKQETEKPKDNKGVEDELKKLDEPAPNKPDASKSDTPSKK